MAGPPAPCPLPDVADREWLVAEFVDQGGRIVGRTGEAGGRDMAVIDLRDLARAMLASGCVALRLHHGHPSGDPRPSAADLAATRRVHALAAALGVRLDDHLIWAGRACFSFRAAGLL
jgi:DNA repair protein RadC